MKTIGIIAEFNPFHNGHKYLIEKSKEVTGADNVVIITSGNYVQRGTPAFIDKGLRAKAAIDNGADAVFELPLIYSTASAELFARGAISFLNQLNCIDYLCFGCEIVNLKLLPLLANILENEPEEFKTLLNNFLKQGYSFPKARVEALCQYCADKGSASDFETRTLLSSPNNILALEYIKAIKHFGSSIKPVAIKRVGADYDSKELDNVYASASGIRESILKNDFDSVKKHIPENTFSQLDNCNYLTIEDFNTILGYKLAIEDNFSQYYGINEDLSNRISSLKSDYVDIPSFITLLQSKNNTYAAISRGLLHIILSIKEYDVTRFINEGYHKHARLLGFNNKSKILSIIKDNSTLPIISKFSTYYGQCDDVEKYMLDMSIKSDNIYRMIYQSKYGKKLPNEFERQLYIK